MALKAKQFYSICFNNEVVAWDTTLLPLYRRKIGKLPNAPNYLKVYREIRKNKRYVIANEKGEELVIQHLERNWEEETTTIQTDCQGLFPNS